MGKRILVVTFTVAAVLSATAAAATVNCNVVNRELKLGKWPADVALGMGVTLAEVNSCKESPPPHSNASPKAVGNSASSKDALPPGQAKKLDR